MLIIKKKVKNKREKKKGKEKQTFSKEMNFERNDFDVNTCTSVDGLLAI